MSRASSILLSVLLSITLLHSVSALRVNPNTVTLSGISAGAAFAVQYEIAFSSKIHGAGIIAGIPYYCAQNLVAEALTECMSMPYLIDLSVLLSDAELAEKLGYIDALSNVASHNVMLFSGLDDTVVAQGVMDIVQQMYQKLNVKSLTGYFNYTAEHAWITNFYGNKCSHLGDPFINNCGLDFAYHFLKTSWKSMDLRWKEERRTYNASWMHEFDMSQFGANQLNSMDTKGYLFVPPQCEEGEATCHLHVNFHGCNQYRSYWPSNPTEYVSHTGLNEWAIANNIVILYPQTVASQIVPYNPEGCFDWWGYTGSNYASKTGTQMKIVEKAIASMLPKNGGRKIKTLK